MTKYLGKISSVKFGIGGYQDAMLGLHLCFDFDGSGVCTTISAWDYTRIEHTKYTKWTEQSRQDQYAEIMCKISKYLSQAKVNDVSKLLGIPVEVTLKDNVIDSWRILEEVL